MQCFFEKLVNAIEVATASCRSKNLALSGGLDSSIIAYFLKQKNIDAIAVTSQDFVSSDLSYCQIVAKKFDIQLEIKIASTKEWLSAIEEVIKILKNFNDIEIRNSIVIYLALSEIKKKGYSNIITGDGADELFAGYSFFLKKNEKELEEELKRIWNIMHFSSISIGKSLGVTVETPFLDQPVIELAKNIPANLKVGNYKGKKIGKWILRKAFEDKLPKNIVWRDKSPIQDGAGTASLTQFFNSIISDDLFESKCKKIQKSDNVIIRTKESLHYYEIFKKLFDSPEKLHSSKTKCPYCKYEIKQSTNFCRMCGSYPL